MKRLDDSARATRDEHSRGSVEAFEGKGTAAGEHCRGFVEAFEGKGTAAGEHCRSSVQAFEGAGGTHGRDFVDTLDDVET